MSESTYVAMDDLLAGLEQVRAAPKDRGELRLIVRRPSVGERELVERAELRTDVGLDGDTWRQRGSRHTDDGSAEVERQLTIMSARAAALFAGTDDRQRWALAGDQLYLDLDLTAENLPPGTRLAVGEAIVEITDPPHTGCAKFIDPFGQDAARLANVVPEGRALNLRGINARVVSEGTIRTGDPATKLRPTDPC